VERQGVLPGPPLWSECVVSIDANQDGLLDIFVLNAQGYAVPGDYGAPSSDPLPPNLLIHQGVVQGIPTFQDQSATLLPLGFVAHGKQSAVCDVDGDGLLDLVIATAFSDQQRILRKDPNGPGYLDETHRLPPLILNSFGVGWGDFDDDGDIDLVFTDAGASSFGGAGGKARLLINDGTGFFTDAPGRLNAINKIGAQNAKIVDIDSDLDLDIVVDGKSAVSQVYLNDGSGNFTLDTTLIPAAVSVPGAGAYETEWGDLDGDLDLDCLYMNFAGSGFPTTDVAMENQMSQSGVPSLVTIPNAFRGQNAQDENEFALLDTDDDGDLDVLVAALTFGTPITPEKLFLNTGTLGPAFLVQSPDALTGILDSTLDMAIADFNGDGRYDIVTANGEIPTSSFDNLYYENTGPQDTKAPTIGRVSSLPAFLSIHEIQQGLPVRSWIQDSVVDDGISFVEAKLIAKVTKEGLMVQSSERMPHIGGQVHRALLSPQRTSAGIVGAMVSVEVEAHDPAGNTSISDEQQFVVCGSESYGAGTGLTLNGPTRPTAISQFDMELYGGEPGRPGILWQGTGKASIPLGGGTFLVDPNGAIRIVFVLDGSGAATLSVPLDQNAGAGDGSFFQAFARSMSTSAGLVLSNGVQTVLCD
jgi:hypothetical protein